jgi:hypothetical protein
MVSSVGVNNDIIEDLSQYFANTEQRYADYQTICSRIRKEIRNDQIQVVWLASTIQASRKDLITWLNIKK